MLIFGYWIMGNRQIFLNKVSPRETFHKNPDPEHHLLDINAAGVTQDKMIFLFLFLYVFIKIYAVCIKPFISGKNKLQEDIDIDEGLDPYWNCLSGSQ